MMNRRGALAAMAAATLGAVPSGAALVRLLRSGQAQQIQDAFRKGATSSYEAFLEDEKH